MMSGDSHGFKLNPHRGFQHSEYQHVVSDIKKYLASSSDVRTYGGFLSHGGTPSLHPFLDGIFQHSPSIFGYPNDELETSIRVKKMSMWIMTIE